MKKLLSLLLLTIFSSTLLLGCSGKQLKEGKNKNTKKISSETNIEKSKNKKENINDDKKYTFIKVTQILEGTIKGSDSLYFTKTALLNKVLNPIHNKYPDLMYNFGTGLYDKDEKTSLTYEQVAKLVKNCDFSEESGYRSFGTNIVVIEHKEIKENEDIWGIQIRPSSIIPNIIEDSEKQEEYDKILKKSKENHFFESIGSQYTDELNIEDVLFVYNDDLKPIKQGKEVSLAYAYKLMKNNLNKFTLNVGKLEHYFIYKKLKENGGLTKSLIDQYFIEKIDENAEFNYISISEEPEKDLVATFTENKEGLPLLYITIGKPELKITEEKNNPYIIFDWLIKNNKE